MENQLKQLQADIETLKGITTAQEVIIKLLLNDGVTPRQRAIIRHQLQNAVLGSPLATSARTPPAHIEAASQALADFVAHLKG
ncbi:hypothetical protein P9J82_02165 [Glaesserella parasuis]|uniref:Uncharacterized protein n=1 Tax=Glaesserella parasuis serovar 5 (strain SH0165) TaxID=557723 RepID=B8F598_GLAP5|nr:hypothetical protein [Glaesserella parasuis]ACL32500.1 hypothetical protein HAPS_0871 [Glaesserella parasuis SH0165]MCT8552474.1 hypothetical protein [Glaesserella parasuis]MCT8755909.1 hypothetical protein [Glaesserella parasuis]MDG4924222.1 hypothetical protein [Glaesserella parasuis]MDG6226692.1 hypothetical protein [Glaesserella parasuis]